MQLQKLGRQRRAPTYHQTSATWRHLLRSRRRVQYHCSLQRPEVIQPALCTLYSDWAMDWTFSSSNLGSGQRGFSSLKRPGWLWGLPGLLFHGYGGSFLWVRRSGRGIDQSPAIVPKLNKHITLAWSGAIFPFNFTSIKSHLLVTPTGLSLLGLRINSDSTNVELWHIFKKLFNYCILVTRHEYILQFFPRKCSPLVSGIP